MNHLPSTDAILRSLNPAQRKAVQTVEGPLMTLAGPGSGKTRVVTHRIAYMIDQGIPSTSILALTFTNKAAQAIRERVTQLIGPQTIAMGTFHGFGARFLRRYGRSVGLPENFSIYDSDDALRTLEQAILEARVDASHSTVAEIGKEISILKMRLITPDLVDESDVGRRKPVVAKIYPVYQKLLRECGAVDFDDLLLHPAVILRTEPDLRAELDQRYEYIMVDEYQDTNYAQYVIVRSLSIDHPHLNVTGDPDQSIYGWRGATIENILSFERDFPNTRIVRLEENYRSTPQILSVADALIQHNARRKEKTLIATRTDGARVRLAYYLTDEAEAENIADQIRSSIIDRGERPGDFAILYRTNAQSRLLEKALLSRRLRYQLIGGFRFYQRQEIKDLLAYLRLVHNPRDDMAFRRAINTPPRGLGDKTIQQIAAIGEREGLGLLEATIKAVDSKALSKKTAASCEQFVHLYSQLIELASSSLVETINHLVAQTQYLDYLAKKKAVTEEEEIDANIREFLSDARQADERSEPGQALEHLLEEVSLHSDADALEDSTDRVTLMTLHSAKGLEFPNVFLIAIEQNVLPHIRAMKDADQYEEERRLMFVGITRAKERLQLSLAARRGFQQRTSVPSQFLMEIPRLEIEIVDLRDGGYADDGYDHDPLDESGEHAVSEVFYEFDRDEDRDVMVPSSSMKSKIPPGLERHTGNLPSHPLTRAIKSGAAIRPLTTQSGAEISDFRDGVRVIHPMYGDGVVISVDGQGVKRRVIVRFGRGETKTFVLVNSQITLG